MTDAVNPEPQDNVVTGLGRVAVLLGGHSAEREVSLRSGQAVLSALQSHGVQAEAFDPAERPITQITGYDRVFIALHGRGGEDGTLQGLLQWLNVPFTGSGVLASAIGMDKGRTKQLWQGCGLPTARFCLVQNSDDYAAVAAQVGETFILKPVHEGSSIGMSKVSSLADWPAAIAKARQHDAVVMAESWITGKEYTVVILDGQALPVIRLEPPADVAFYDFDAKYQRNDTQYHIPSGLTEADQVHIQSLALQAFEAVGAAGWGRIDAMQDEQGQWWLLEINTSPGMTDHSLVPMAARAVGIDFPELCLRVLQQTLLAPASHS